MKQNEINALWMRLIRVMPLMVNASSRAKKLAQAPTSKVLKSISWHTPQKKLVGQALPKADKAGENRIVFN